MQPKCYSYIRFSTPEQRKGDSLRRQTEAAEEWAARNGQTLDDALKLQDLGISGYSGAHRAKGALGKFLELVKAGRIAPGSVFLVENLDRLSREQALDALGLFTDIIKAGIKIVTLADGMEYTRETINANMMQLMMSLVILSRGHEESLMKSKRITAAWAGKRARLNEKKLTGRAPAWLELSPDKTVFHAVPERVKAVQRIFEMKAQGIGGETIAKALNREGVWSPKNGWRKSYITKILSSRAVLGEFQPQTKEEGKRIPTGDPLPDYFPRIISDELFHAVQARLASNRGKGGRNGRVSNLFGHIAKCGDCGASMTFIDKGAPPKGGRYLLCDTARRGRGCHRHSIKYQAFEDLILTYCRGLSVGELLPDAEQAQTATEAARGRLAAIQGENTAIQGKVDNLGAAIAEATDKRVRELLQARLPALLDRAEALKEHEREAVQEISQLSSVSENTQARLDSLNELMAFMARENTEDVAAVRMRLRGKLRGLIERIKVYPVGKPRMTLEGVEKRVQAVLDVQPELAGTAELERVRAGLLDRIDNKAYGTCTVHFHGGSFRVLNLGKEPGCMLEFDRERGGLVDADTGTVHKAFQQVKPYMTLEYYKRNNPKP